MINIQKRLFFTAILGFLAVALGALGAHALRDKMEAGIISPRQFEGFETAVRYHMFHVLAILSALLAYRQTPQKLFITSTSFFLIGIALFSGSIYLLSIRQLIHAEWLKILGPVTPLGGIALMVGWIYLGLAFLKKS